MTPQQVDEAAEETVGTHYHSQATTTNYEGRIKNFKQYIADTRPELVSCLEKGGLNENTPIACKHYLANEMEKKQLSFSTADGVRSALKGWFYHAHDCYNGEYHLVAGQWRGNPINSKVFQVYFESVKRKAGRNAEPDRCAPMLQEQMEVLVRWLKSEDCSLKGWEAMMCLAYFTSAWYLWTRSEELCNLQVKYIKLNQEDARAGSDYHSIELIWRKTNQNDPLKGSTYRMYPATEEQMALDAFYYLNDWVEYLNNNFANGLQPDDYLFPQITQNSKTGVSPFRRESPLTTKMIGNYLQKCITGSNLLETIGAGYKFTTHCFRRGGAQHRFMYAKMRWSLKAVRWWGGWAKGESKDVIIKYLLEELGKNEDDYGDMMRPGRAQESSRREYFSPEDAEGEMAVTEELQNIRAELAQARRDFEVMDSKFKRPPIYQRLLTTPTSFSPIPSSSTSFNPIPSSSNTATPPQATTTSAASGPTPPSDIDDPDSGASSASLGNRRRNKRSRRNKKSTGANLQNGNIQHPLPTIKYWFDAVKQWSQAGPGLANPLKNWNEKERAANGDNFSNRKLIALEVEFCGGMARFDAIYNAGLPDNSFQHVEKVKYMLFSNLLKAIWKKRKEESRAGEETERQLVRLRLERAGGGPQAASTS
ncbi:hypothetical protein DFS34DRAFT_608753 [Phlyctochytrium arcticum]|nr:hypothetical protein DFS34DRAFT_608753 [Phlyctochytrium arcticum]